MGDKAPYEAELQEMNAATRFSEQELRGMYEHAGAEGQNGFSAVSEVDFNAMCTEHGLTSGVLQHRLWDVFDDDDDQCVTTKELILSLNALKMGTIDDLTKVRAGCCPPPVAAAAAAAAAAAGRCRCC